MRVLVTGAGGYTGSRLVRRLLAEGDTVRALVHRPADAPALRALGARVVVGDVGNRATLAGIAANIDIVYHLVGTLAGGEGSMRRTMVEGTRHLIDACLAAGAGAGAGGPLRGLIFAGNAVVYGDGAGALLDEGSPCHPTFSLGRLNQAVEEELRRAQAARGLPVTILRLGAIYGPGRLSSALIRQGRFRIIGDGRCWSSRIYIDDLLAALVILGRQALRDEAGVACGGGDPAPPMYCVADEEPCSVGTFYGELAGLLGVPPPGHIPVWLARLRGQARTTVARLRGRTPYVNEDIIGLFTSDLRLDGSRLRERLGLSLRYPSYREGLRAALEAEAPADQRSW